MAHSRHALSSSLNPQSPTALMVSFSPVGSGELRMVLESESTIKVERLPRIREMHYGIVLSTRTAMLERRTQESGLGPASLFHLGKHCSGNSHEFIKNPFVVGEYRHQIRKEDDGFVGYYHYVDGINVSQGQSAIERYILQNVGIQLVNDSYYFTKSSAESYANCRNELVASLYMFNAFLQADLSVKYIINFGSTPSYKSPLSIEKSIHISSRSPEGIYSKILTANMSEIALEKFWAELYASEVLRLTLHLDNPSLQVSGLVCLPDCFQDSRAISEAVRGLVRFLPRGSLTGSITSRGASTGNDDASTLRYQNNLVQALIRICASDISGNATDYTVEEIRNVYYTRNQHIGEWDYVILKLLKVQLGSNNEQLFIKLIHDHLEQDSISTQLALITLEQVNFLVSRKHFDTALLLATRCVQLLPLSFDAWHSLALCYILLENYEKALTVLNASPVLLSSRNQKTDLNITSDTRDLFNWTFVERLNTEVEAISEVTFNSYFPPLQVSSGLKSPGSKAGLVDLASMKSLWKDLFIFNSHRRHPISGNVFYQSPLTNCTPKELSSISPSLINVCGPGNSKNLLSSQSSGSASTSILTFTRDSTWGRCYSLLSIIVAKIGWDRLLQVKESAFKQETGSPLQNAFPGNAKEYVVNHEFLDTKDHCGSWFEELITVLYEDYSVLYRLTADKQSTHSAIEWEMIGLLGWNCKYNLKESILSLFTSVKASHLSQGDFDYFSTVQLLEIYYEFVLSEVLYSNIDVYHDDYNNSFFDNKLILRNAKKDGVFDDFVAMITNECLTLDFILTLIMQLVSWNVRWYQLVPNYLILKVLNHLCLMHDVLTIRSQFRILFELNKQVKKTNKNRYTISAYFLNGSPTSPVKELSPSNTKLIEIHELDTILYYLDSLLDKIEKNRMEGHV